MITLKSLFLAAFFYFISTNKFLVSHDLSVDKNIVSFRLERQLFQRVASPHKLYDFIINWLYKAYFIYILIRHVERLQYGI
jgi:hypothetical protein